MISIGPLCTSMAAIANNVSEAMQYPICQIFGAKQYFCSKHSKPGQKCPTPFGNSLWANVDHVTWVINTDTDTMTPAGFYFYQTPAEVSACHLFIWQKQKISEQ